MYSVRPLSKTERKQEMIKKYSEEKRLEVINARKDGATFHRDQGRNYTSYAFRNCLREHGVHQSFSNPATPYDNAVAEAFFSVLKREDISHSYYQTRKDLENAVANYIEFYNSMRPHRKLHNLSPDAFERSFNH